nr:immunoglobulin heavy chain junction region [Mus musculus]
CAGSYYAYDGFAFW